MMTKMRSRTALPMQLASSTQQGQGGAFVPITITAQSNLAGAPVETR